MYNHKLIKGISIIICCYNSADVIVPTIKSIANQKIDKNLSYELIIVDNNCTDKTLKLIKSNWVQNYIPIRFVSEKKPGLIYARKKGIDSAVHDIIFFVDDDNILVSEWLTRIYDIFEKRQKIGALGGFVEPYPEIKPPDWFHDFLGVYACGAQGKPGRVSYSRMMLVGAGLSIRTNLVKNILNMDVPLYLIGRTEQKQLRGDDAEICMRCVLLGWDLWYDDSLKIKHYIKEKRINWEFVLSTRNGGGAADIILHMYRQILNKNKPLTYSELSKNIIEESKTFWNSIKEIDILRKEGSSKGFQYAFLTGKTEFFLELGQSKYNAIVQELTNKFRKKENSDNYVHVKKNYFRNKMRGNKRKINSMEEEKVKKDLLVTNADKNFVKQAKQLFSSAYFNSGWDGDYMLLSQGIPSDELNWFSDRGILVKKCEPLLMEEQHSIGSNKWPLTVLNTIYLFNSDFRKWRTIICVDADMIIRASLDSLRGLKGIYAVQGLFAPTLGVRIYKHKNKISNEMSKTLRKEYKFSSPTFNGGVIVFSTDLIEIETFDELKKLLYKYQGSLTSNEEEILNLYFHRKWKKLPYVFNVYVNSLRDPGAADGIILHFMGYKGTEEEKPWNKKSLYYHEWKTNLVNAEKIDLLNIPIKIKEWDNIKIKLKSLEYNIRNKKFYYHLTYGHPASAYMRKIKRRFRIKDLKKLIQERNKQGR